MDTDISSYEKPIQRTAKWTWNIPVQGRLLPSNGTNCAVNYEMACVIAAQLLKLCDDIVECHFLFLETCQFSVAIFREC